MNKDHLSQTKFGELAIHPDLLQGIHDAGFEYCTPIQSQTLPIALSGTDICGQAQTGTGKTAAFLIACMNHLLNTEKSLPTNDHSSGTTIRTLILAPTRELAIQIFEDAKPLAKTSKLKLALAYGGSNSEKQRDKILAGTDILIGTPGRVIDFFKQGVFSLKQLDVIVLDEADRMFDLGFIDDIRYLFRNMPKPEDRLSLLFSATLSLRVSELAYEHLNQAQTIKVEEQTITAKKIDEKAYMPANKEKAPLLIGLLNSFEKQKCVVFTNTKFSADLIYDWLKANNICAAILSGNVPQNKRETLLKRFKTGQSNILIATDVAARGLHIPLVKYVINYDLPNDAEDYVHRIGRTARAGESGTAISFICEDYAINIIDIENLIGYKIPVDKEIKGFISADCIKPETRSNIKKNTPTKKHHKTQSADTKTNRKRSEQPKQHNQTKNKKSSAHSTDTFNNIDQESIRQSKQKPNIRRSSRDKIQREVPLVG